MFTLTAKITLTLTLSGISVLLFLIDRCKLRFFCMIAMIFGTFGDLFLSNVIGSGGYTFYVGSLCFVAEHLIDGANFLLESRRKKYRLDNVGFRIGLTVTILTAAVLAVLAFTVPQAPQTLMFFLILIYIAAIGFNLAMQFSFAHSEKGLRYLIAAGALLFLFSDTVIFLNLLNIHPYSDNLCWGTYVPAQAFTILFCRRFGFLDKFRKQEP